MGTPSADWLVEIRAAKIKPPKTMASAPRLEKDTAIFFGISSFINPSWSDPGTGLGGAPTAEAAKARSLMCLHRKALSFGPIFLRRHLAFQQYLVNRKVT
jgi:hypothetical protein